MNVLLQESQSKNKFLFGVRGGGRGRWRQMNRRTGPNEFAPSTFLKLGA